MKKIVIGFLLLIFVSSIYAEPATGESWAQYIVRANTMSDRLDNVNFNGDKWEDKWAAAWATHGWLQISYSHILYYADRGTISLTQQERGKYTLLKQYHTNKAGEFDYNIRYFSGSTGQWVIGRYDYWMDVLNKGGTINFR
jgi:hypothetical protein